MTVVFTDLVGSTSLGERLDPESLSEKFIGDAIMAVFGIPTLHEDDALRGVLALRADDFVDLLFQQLGQHTEPDADAQRQQSLLRRPDQLPQRLPHRSGSTTSSMLACATDTPQAVPPRSSTDRP